MHFSWRSPAICGLQSDCRLHTPLIEHIIKKDPTYSSEMKANQLQARKVVKAKKSKATEEEADLLAQALDEQQK